MCILFWYQNDGTNNPIKINSDPGVETSSKAGTEGANQNTPQESDKLQVNDPKSLLDLDSGSEMSQELEGLTPTQKLLHNFKLIIASNRDEFYDRATKPLHFWNDAACDIVAGKDMKAGGTWLGVSRKYKCASVILNKYSPDPEERPVSRGSIVVNNLRNHEKFNNKLKRECSEQKYSPFFLLNFDFAADLKTTYFVCDEKGELKESKIEGSGFCSHSNSEMEQKWMKTEKGGEKFEELVTETLNKTSDKSKLHKVKELKNSLLKLLQDTQRYEDSNLMKNYEKFIKEENPGDDPSFLSAVCVKSRSPVIKYGTRTNTILIVDKSNEIFFIQTDYLTNKEEFYRFSV